MDKKRMETRLREILAIKTKLDLVWPYSQEDIILRHNHRIMKERCQELETQLRRQLGHMAVYPIVNGSSQEACFEGSPQECKDYIETYCDCVNGAEFIVLGV